MSPLRHSYHPMRCGGFDGALSVARMASRISIATTLGCVALLSAACQGRSDSLASVPVPSGFTFSTTRTVELKVSGSAEVLGGPEAVVEVALPSGEAVYRGPLRAGVTRDLWVTVPKKDGALRYAISGTENRVEGTISITRDQATLDLR